MLKGDGLPDAVVYEIKAVTDARLETRSLKAIHAAARTVARGVYVEIGPAQGGSTVAIALGRQAAGRREPIYTADVFRASEALKSADIDTNVEVLRRNLAHFGVREGVEIIVVGPQDLATAVPPSAEIGLLFIDADGALDRDFDQFYDRVIPGGVIIVDDYQHKLAEKYVGFAEDRLNRYVKSKGVEHIQALNPLGKHYTVYRLVRRLVDLGLVEEIEIAWNTAFLRKIGGASYGASGAAVAMAQVRADIAKEFFAWRSGHGPPTPGPSNGAVQAVRMPAASESVFGGREPRNTKFILAAIRGYLFDELQRRKDEVRFIHVGAGDGLTADPGQPADPVRSRALDHGWRGLLVEPAPAAFERLQANYAGGAVDFANVAIWCEDGGKVFHVLEAAERFSGFFLETIARYDAGGRDLRSATRPIQVMARRLDTLCRETGHTKADVLVVDAEGADDLVIQTFDFAAHRPDIVQFKHTHLTSGASARMQDLLTGLGYTLLYDLYDVVAVLTDRFDPQLIRFCQDLMFTARAN